MSAYSPTPTASWEIEIFGAEKGPGLSVNKGTLDGSFPAEDALAHILDFPLGTIKGGSTWASRSFPVAITSSIFGNVFEDVNYGGGSGRNRNTAILNGGTGRSGVRVELYNASDSFVTSTLTNASGIYIFAGLAPGDYTVRVVNSTVSSARTGYISGTHLAVQTYRTDVSSGTPIAVTDYVGGEVPNKVDAGNGSTTLAALSTGTTTAQSISSVTVGASDIPNIDFGFSFNLIVNNNNIGQGSLRQLILNANTLSNTGLAIQGRTAGIDHAIFMISNGTAVPGLRASNNYFSAGVTTIVPSPEITWVGAPLILDATTQPGYAGSPLIQLDGSSTAGAANGLTLRTNDSKIAGFIVHSFADDGVEVRGDGGVGDNNTIQSNWVGLNASGMAAPNGDDGVIVAFAAAGNLIGGPNPGEGNVISGNNGDGVQLRDFGTDNNIVQGNFIGTDVTGSLDYGNGRNGVLSGTVNNIIGGDITTAGNVISGNNTHGILLSGATSNTVQGNIIGLNEAGNAAIRNEGNGITMSGGGNHQVGGSSLVLRNVISGNNNSGTTADGIYIPGSVGNIIQGNYIGTDITGNFAFGNYSAGIACDGNTNAIGGVNPGEGNLIAHNGSFGIRVGTSNNGNIITRNSIHDNGGLGIDLGGDGITINDLNDADLGSNTLHNYPILSTAQIVGTDLVVTGFARPTSSIEFFISDNDPSGFGEGLTYLYTLIEGSLNDDDASAGVYGPSAINGFLQGTDNTNAFSVTLPVPTGVVNGTMISATSTLAGNTSEFSAVKVVVGHEICGNGIDDDGDGKIDEDDPQCFDNDQDGITNGFDLDDDNDGVPDSLDSASDLELFTQFGVGTSFSGTGNYSVEGTNVSYASSFVGSECVTYNAGLQGPALKISEPSNSFTPVRIDFSTPVYNLFFKVTDIDWTEEFDLYVYDENFDLYDLRTNGVISVGSNILQNQIDGRRFSGQGLGIDTDGNDPANDHICSALFHFPGQVGTVILNIRTFSGNSIRLTEMDFNVIDTDSDGLIDSWDLDSDNDGIYDVIEAGGADADGDGVIGTGPITDTDSDGWSDISDPDNGGTLLPNPDTDSDGLENRVDSDSDGDGCSDVIEAGFPDSDGDGQLGGLVPPTVDSTGKVTSGGL